MIWVYLLTTLIALIWIIKMLQTKKLLIKKTPLDIPILVFLSSMVLSTFFSIDRHISIFGYYSRSNGGLLSIISYLILYYALVSNFNQNQTIKLIKAMLLGGLVVALWAIPEHFGASVSCWLLTGQLDTNCWVQDVQSRVFATLGQPNWLAAYLGFLIFPIIYFIQNAKSKKFLILNSSLLILYYLAFTFTYSRGATLGLIGGAITLLIFIVLKYRKKAFEILLPSAYFLVPILIITLVFGSALTSFKLLNKFSPPPRSAVITTSTQLESGGTESGQIRLIVWAGALQIFKHYPIFGSGVETFAYSYYMFRPIEHNLVSEWDFLYNKAHNEYLNYLSTTGLLGLGSYLLLISVFIGWTVRKIMHLPATRYQLLATSLLAGYTSNLIQQFFGFSVVITNLFFYLFPALIITLVADQPYLDLFSSTKWQKLRKLLVFKRILMTVTVLIFLVPTIILGRIWLADTFYAQGQKANDSGNPGRAYNFLLSASDLNPREPLYQAELGLSAAGSSVALTDSEATLSATMKVIASGTTDKVLAEHPYNISLFRSAIRTYYLLSTLDPKFTQKTLETIDKTIKLAPTDPKIRYNKALVLESDGQTDQAIRVLQEILKLKPNYKEAQDLLKKLSNL